jgi:hypothetical protein
MSTPGLFWVTRADALRLGAPAPPMYYTLNLRLVDPSQATGFVNGLAFSPLLVGLRLAARRPRRAMLTAISIAITVATVVGVLTFRQYAQIARHGLVPIPTAVAWYRGRARLSGSTAGSGEVGRVTGRPVGPAGVVRLSGAGRLGVRRRARPGCGDSS